MHGLKLQYIEHPTGTVPHRRYTINHSDDYIHVGQLACCTHSQCMYVCMYVTHRVQLRTGAMAIVRPDTLSTTMSLVTLWIVCIQYVCVCVGK